jgi:multimeric flavodoxin WrbA
MKVIGINGSPRKKASNTLKLVEAVLDGAKEEGAKTEVIDICQLDIDFCTGCLSCFSTGDCVYDDDVAWLLKKMMKADGIVLGSPVYIDSVTAQLKRWIDRSANTMHCMMLLGKYGCAVSTSGGFKEQEVADYLNHVITDLGIVSIGGVGIAMAKGADAFANAMRRAHDLGRDLVHAIKKEKRFPEGEAQVEERKEFFKKLILTNKDPWQFQYEFWGNRGEFKQ